MTHHANRYESATRPLCYADQTLVQRGDYVLCFDQTHEGRVADVGHARVWDTLYYENGDPIGTVLVDADAPERYMPELHTFEHVGADGQSRYYFKSSRTFDEHDTARRLQPLFRAGNYLKIWQPDTARISMHPMVRRLPYPKPSSFNRFFFLRSILRLAAAGDSACLFALGLRHLRRGRAVKAIAFWQRAAENHSPDAWLELGLAYETGSLLGANEVKAALCFLHAARRGSPLAQYRLAMCYVHGKGIAHSDEEAAYWLGEAAKRGLPAACFEMGRYYRHGAFNYLRLKNSPHNRHAVYCPHPERSAAMFAKAALVSWPGAAAAKFHLAECYREGKGVIPDRHTAMRLYREAVEEGDIADEDIQTAAYHARLTDVLGAAADNGHIYAAYLYGRMYWRGEPERDRLLGRRYLRQAAESGHECAEEAALLLSEKESGF